MTPIHIDFESRSSVDLKKASTHTYAVHPSTYVWCMAYAIGEGEIKIWKNGEPFPQDILDFVATKQPYYFIAHNANFELTIWNELCVPRYNWPPLPIHRTYCTMAMAYAMALPGSLENAAIALGLDVAKDKEGRSLMIQMASPRKIFPDGTFTWWDQPDKLNRLYDYCKNDVLVERELEKRLRPLSDKERKVWLLDHEINNRGIPVDHKSIIKAMGTVESEKARLNDIMFEATSEYVAGSSDLINLKDFLVLNGVPAEGLAKANIRELLDRDDLPGAVRIALTLRQEGAKSSTAKLKAMLSGAGEDFRVRGTMQYHGAATGRWAGRKLQPQNMPKGELNLTPRDIQDVIDHIDSPQYLAAMHGAPLTVISDCLRAMIAAKPGHDFIAADFSAIEARVLAWLANQQSTLDIFKKGDDIYKHAAAGIFGVPIEKVTKLMRQVGKTAILALGYQGGVGAFLTMAKSYNVDMAIAYEPLMKTASKEQQVNSTQLFKRYIRKNCEKAKAFTPEQWEEVTTSDAIALGETDKSLPSYEVFMAADLTKRLWREANPAIVEYWYNLEGAAMAATLNPKTVYEVKIPGNHRHRHVKFIKSGSFLWCVLPSGRKICYPYPCIKETVPPWADEDDNETKPTLCYMGVNGTTRSWQLEKAYGGLFAENITQGVARDFLVEAMFNAEDNNYTIIFHVHDELVCEVPKGFGSVEELINLITASTEWGYDCPIAAEGCRSDRYQK